MNTAIDDARRFALGETTAEAIAQAALATVAQREQSVQAFAFLDPAYVQEQARLADLAHQEGRATGSLGGVLIGIKDVIDTSDMPTENGALIHAGRKPARDAACVTALREAGAIIMGKTVTTELASYHPGKTRNPHRENHTPGGSSSGSAAAVAAGMCHAALGTQTNGSIIRPASYCGVIGFKPSFGLISRTGCLEQSAALDTVGVFARTVADTALVADALTRFDDADKAMWPRAKAALLPVATAEAPVDPRFAFVKGPGWPLIEPDAAEAFAELTEALGQQCATLDLGAAYDSAVPLHQAIMHADIARNYGPLFDAAPDKISQTLAAIIADGRKVLAVDYNTALDMQRKLRLSIEQLFEHFNAIITPASAGPAPEGLTSTGNPLFCTSWTFMGLPAISLPLLEVNGMPMGVQLTGAFGDEARLLRTANWLIQHLSQS